MTFRDDKALATAERNKFVNTFKLAVRMKTRMVAKQLTVAKAKCPYCDGYWRAALAGPKKHFHMKCDGCGVQVME